MTAAEMSKLFDVDVESNLDTDIETEYDFKGQSTARPFDEKIQDIKSMMPKEEYKPKPTPPPVQKTEEEIIQTAIAQNKPVESVKVMEKVAEMYELPAAPTPTPEVKDTPVDPDNPLELSGDLLKAYKKITAQYPQFTLTDGSQAFKSFYRFKVSMLKEILTRFPILNLKEMRSEAKGTHIDHFVGSDDAHPDIIGGKLDDAFRCRARLGTLMIDALEQLPAWKRCLEMLQSKLYKEHDIKGAHKRDSLVLEHLKDVEMYVSEMQGFYDTAKMLDGLLHAAAESLSRQLSCLQIKHSAGISSHKPVEKHRRDSSFDTLDGISEGTVVERPTKMGVTMTENWGAASDDGILSDIG